jgi:hypothetical protein
LYEGDQVEDGQQNQSADVEHGGPPLAGGVTLCFKDSYRVSRRSDSQLGAKMPV